MMGDAHNYLMAMHHQICFENGDHPDEIDTPYSLGADAINRAPTNAQALANPKVQALVEALGRQVEAWSNALELDIIATQHRSQASIILDDARAALAALENPDE